MKYISLTPSLLAPPDPTSPTRPPLWAPKPWRGPPRPDAKKLLSTWLVLVSPDFFLLESFCLFLLSSLPTSFLHWILRKSYRRHSVLMLLWSSVTNLSLLFGFQRFGQHARYHTSVLSLRQSGRMLQLLLPSLRSLHYSCDCMFQFSDHECFYLGLLTFSCRAECLFPHQIDIPCSFFVRSINFSSWNCSFNTLTLRHVGFHSLLVLRYYEHLFLFFMLKLHVTSSRFCSNLLNMYFFTCKFSHTDTEAHKNKHTGTISTQEEWPEPGTGAWLSGAGKRLC